MKVTALAVWAVAGVLFLVGCGGGASPSFNNPPPPPPTITRISPNSDAAGGAPFTLTINGTNFIAASTVNFGGAAPATTFVNSTQLTAAIPSAAIASAGTATVTVTNPAPGGGTSNAANFTISNGSNPVPTIGFLFPSCAPAGGPSFTLQVSGANFVTNSVVQWNGSNLQTTFNGASFVEAQVPASDIAAVGNAAITVSNPAPGGGTSNPVTVPVSAGGAFPDSIAVDPSGKFVYVADMGCGPTFGGNVSMYTVNTTTGALTSIGTVAAGIGPFSVAVDPKGKFAYVANFGFGPFTVPPNPAGVSMYTINGATGALTPMGAIAETCPTELCTASSVTVHPSGKFVYVANGYPEDDASLFTVDPNTGALTFRGSIATVSPLSSTFTEIGIDPSGKFAYAVGDNCSGDEANDSSVSAFIINLATGALSSTGSPVPTELCPSSVTVDALGKFAYVTNFTSNDVSMYTIDRTTGALTSIGTIAAGTQPVSIAVDPTGKFAFVANESSSDVSMYTIDGTTGALTSIGTIAAGTGPVSVAVDPSGKFAYVANFGSNNVSMYSIDATTGALTLIGTIGT